MQSKDRRESEAWDFLESAVISVEKLSILDLILSTSVSPVISSCVIDAIAKSLSGTKDQSLTALAVIRCKFLIELQFSMVAWACVIFVVRDPNITVLTAKQIYVKPVRINLKFLNLNLKPSVIKVTGCFGQMNQMVKVN